MERKNFRPAESRPALELADRGLNLTRARQETENVPGRGGRSLFCCIRYGLPRRVRDLERVRSPRDFHRRTSAQILRDSPGVECCRHDDDAKVVARAPRLFCERDRHVGVNASLVELVDDDRPEVGGKRIALHACRQHTFSHDQQKRRPAVAPIETNLPADLAAERLAALLRYAVRNRTCRHTPGMQQHNRPIVCERRRHTSGLSSARLRGDDEGARTSNVVDDRGDERIDWETRLERQYRPDS